MAYGDLGLPETIKRRDRTMVFKELQLLGWTWQWRPFRSCYRMTRGNGLHIDYVYSFAKDVYELGPAWVTSTRLLRGL